eukprot:780446-Pyramimonas_sp.AAC.1
MLLRPSAQPLRRPRRRNARGEKEETEASATAGRETAEAGTRLDRPRNIAPLPPWMLRASRVLLDGEGRRPDHVRGGLRVRGGLDPRDE